MDCTQDTTQPRRSHFSMVPHLVDDLNLDPYAFRLYVHIVRRAGDGGTCFESTDNLAEHCKMSAGQVSKAKQELKEAGLINIGWGSGPGGKHHVITLVDVWARNSEHFAEKERSQSESQPSQDEHKERSLDESTESVHCMNAITESVHTVNAIAEMRSPCETKNTHVKNTHKDKEEPFSATSAEPVESEPVKEPELEKANTGPPGDDEKRQPRGRNKLKAELEQYFAEITGLPRPDIETAAAKRSAGSRWWSPLLRMAKACDDDLDRARAMMLWAVEHMDAEGLTISAPQSIEQVALAEQAKRKREFENGKTNGRHNNGTGKAHTGTGQLSQFSSASDETRRRVLDKYTVRAGPE